MAGAVFDVDDADVDVDEDVDVDVDDSEVLVFDVAVDGFPPPQLLSQSMFQ